MASFCLLLLCSKNFRVFKGLPLINFDKCVDDLMDSLSERISDVVLVVWNRNMNYFKQKNFCLYKEKLNFIFYFVFSVTELGRNYYLEFYNSRKELTLI